MRTQMPRGWVLLAVVGLAGCNTQATVGPATPPPPPSTSRLSDHTDVDLADWLQTPRPELAQRIAEWTDTIRQQRQHAAENPQSLDLVPGLQPPGTMPVFHQAMYSAKAGFSLPPYLKAGEVDAAAALHLARLGDREAALKLVDPADKDLLNRIDGQRTDRNYPLEWTQLTALAFQSAEWKLATGQAQAAADLVQMHKQLRSLLDGKAAPGPLGAALLPLGRRALVEAAAAWEKSKADTKELANDVKAALKDWGESPPPALALAPGAHEFDAVRLFGRPAAGQALVADTPESVGRVLDLLELPASTDGVQAVVALFDGEKQLTETFVFYRPKIFQTFPETINLAHYLVNHGLASDDPVNGIGLSRRASSGDGLKYEVVLCSRGDAVGGCFRVAGAKPGAPPPAEARDFAAVHLDSTFEQNRLLFARDQNGAVVNLDCQRRPGVVRLPASVAAPAFAHLEREGASNLTASLTLDWSEDELPNALTKIAAPLLAAYGSPRIDGVQDAEGDSLAFVWEDARTRLTLRLPYESNPVVLRAENRPGSETADARLLAAEAKDLDRRKTRLASKPLTWLPRFLEWPGVRLGMTKKQVTDSLPHKDSIDQRNLGGDLTLVFHDDPPAGAAFAVRQAFLRFGSDDHLAEIRIRYQEGPGKTDERHPSLLAALKALGGEPLSLPAPWAGLWPDLPSQEPKPALYRWADDLTVLTCQRDGGGAEAILRDWPDGLTLDQAEEALPPLRFCDEGAGGVLLGQTRASVQQNFPNAKPLENEDAVAVPAPANSPYETLVVWFDAGKVVRVAAQHTARPTDAADATAKMQAAWQRDFDHLGAPRRVEGASGPILQAYGWHDDRVRVRMLTQQTADGPRLFTEWRYWPVTVRR